MERNEVGEAKRDHVSCVKGFQFYPKNHGGTLTDLLFCFKDLDLIVFAFF